MIRSFHFIRQRLLNETSLRQYLLNAIGEILLIVIGILIAIQIDNWNESNNEKKAGIGYLARIKTDLGKDTLYLNEKILQSIELQKTFKLFINSMYEEQTNVEDFTKLISQPYWDRSDLVLEDKTYVEVTNSGKFGYIRNENTRNRIMDYYREYTIDDLRISEMNNAGGEMFTRSSYPRIMRYYEVFKPLYDKEYLLNDQGWNFINNSDSNEFRDLEAVAIFYYMKYSIFENYYRELKADAKEVIQEIEYEINHQ